MTRFVGYLNRRPYLWFVDCDTKAIEPAAELAYIPQGIDELVAIDGAVAVRCGDTCFALETDLSGPPRPLSGAEVQQVQMAKTVVEWPELPACDDPTLHLPLDDGRTLHLRHSAVDHWGTFATLSPDRRYVAVDGCTVPLAVPRPFHQMDLNAPLAPEPHVLGIVDTTSGEIRICDGTFENFTYPPAWTADSMQIYLGPPFEPKRIYRADLRAHALEPIVFRRHAPAPMLDADSLATP